MNKQFDQLERYILYTTLFLLPIAVASISPNPYVIPKLAILVAGVSLYLIVKAIRILVTGKMEFKTGYFDFAVLTFLTAYLVSTIWSTPNKMEALVLPGTATAAIGGAFLYFCLNQLSAKGKNTLSVVIFASGAIFSLLTLFSAIGLFELIPQLPIYMRERNFTPEGGYLPAAIFLTALIPFGIKHLQSVKTVANQVLFGLGTVVILIALGISVYNMLPGKTFTPRFPSYNTGWVISIETLKNSPLMGVGPGNYLTAFNRFRPIEYNQSDLWAVKYQTAKSFPLTMITETGIIGLAALIFIGLAAFRFFRGTSKVSAKELISRDSGSVYYMISLGLLTAAMLIMPATAFIVIFFLVLLSLISPTKESSINLTGTSQASDSDELTTSRLPAFLVSIPMAVIAVAVLFNAGKYVYAEYLFTEALTAAPTNAGKTYDTLIAAIRTNPRVDRYHATFARVNLALADSIARNAAESEEGVTDEHRSQISQLIQQAIQEAKATVTLNPGRAGNWEILGAIYQSIIPLAEGADVFAVQSFSQAIALDPFNPNLRITLGGIFFAAGEYDTAIRIFEQAVSVKPDLANSHYNLAFALKEKGEYDRAIQSMTNVVSLLPRDSQDYELAVKALAEFQQQRAELSADVVEGTEGLNPPQQVDPLLDPRLELPEGSEPPETVEEEVAEDTEEESPVPTQTP
jgi:tetratricopeptide (TPR) repeat protein